VHLQHDIDKEVCLHPRSVTLHDEHGSFVAADNNPSFFLYIDNSAENDLLIDSKLHEKLYIMQK